MGYMIAKMCFSDRGMRFDVKNWENEGQLMLRHRPVTIIPGLPKSNT